MYQPFPGAEILPVPEDVQAMYDWAARKGVKWPKIVYPVLFPPGYIGSMATDTIYPGEAIVTAPNDALLTTKVALSSELNPIFMAEKAFFSEESGSYDDLLLATFMLYEKAKGESSEWGPFLRYQPKNPSNLQDWTSEELSELQDADLVHDTVKSLEAHIETWNNWKNVLSKYPDKFTEEMLALSEYTWAIRLIGTRTFGKFAAYTTFFPVGELLNHDNVETFYTYLRPGDVADCTKRYAGIVNDDDHDAWIYEIHPTIEMSNEIMCIFNFLLNDFYEEELFNLIKVKAMKEDKEHLAEVKLRRIYRPDGIDLTESSEKEMRTVVGPNETYQKGSEVYMSYGRNSNRQLLSVYGFSLRDNHFNFAVIKNQVKNLLRTPEEGAKLQVKDFSPDHYVKYKLKSKVMSLEFLNVLRKLWWKKEMPTEAMFTPTLLELENEILGKALMLLTDCLNSFATTYEEDLKLLSGDLALRRYFAVLYRSQLKEILMNQIEYFTVARAIVTMAQGGSIVSAVESEVNSDKVRFALKGYIAGLGA